MITLHPDVHGKVLLGLVAADGLTVRPHDERLWAEIEAVAARVRTRHQGASPAQVAGLAPARELFKAIGWDPTRYRPSSEALFRRAIRGESLSRINTLVDVNNLCSLEWLLPMGLHDRDRITGDVILRLGDPADGYEAIGKGWYSLEGRLALYDEEGPCGSPTSDSQRSMIRPETSRCLMVIYAPASYSRERMAGHVRTAGERIVTYNGGRVVATALVPEGSG